MFVVKKPHREIKAPVKPEEKVATKKVKKIKKAESPEVPAPAVEEPVVETVPTPAVEPAEPTAAPTFEEI